MAPHPKPVRPVDSTLREGQKRRAYMRPRSKKKADEYERSGGRRDFVRKILRERPICEACLMAVDVPDLRLARDNFKPARARSRDVHEKLPRSAGGDILDPDNVLALCREHHDFAHRSPKLARELGLLRSRYGGTDSQTSGPEPRKDP